MSRKIIGREKRYVEVDVRFEPDGYMRPLAIRFGPEQCTRSTRSRGRQPPRRRGGRRGGPVRLCDPGSGDEPLDGKGPVVCGGQAGGR